VDVIRLYVLAAHPNASAGWLGTRSRSSPGPDCRYLMGLFNAGWPWERDYLIARRARNPLIKIWAYDHLCLFGRSVPLIAEGRSHRT